ncbi:MAG: hypothetical protein WCE95_02235, partial [Nitrososphaeraceae archaeon]
VLAAAIFASSDFSLPPRIASFILSRNPITSISHPNYLKIGKKLSVECMVLYKYDLRIFCNFNRQ